MSGEEKIESLYTKYRIALRSNDIEEILRIGEPYFSTLHGELTCEDRERLQKDVYEACCGKKKVSPIMATNIKS